MDADLTCPSSRCKGEGDWRCRDCGGIGRRYPTLAEWDALRAERDALKSGHRLMIDEWEDLLAERDAYRRALKRIRYPVTIGSAYSIARDALEDS